MRRRRAIRGWAMLCTAVSVLAMAGSSCSTRSLPDFLAISSSETASQVSINIDAGSAGPPLNQRLVGFDEAAPHPIRPLQALSPYFIRLDASLEATLSNGKPAYDCATGTFDPSLLDARLAFVRSEHAIPLVIVDYTPQCLASPIPANLPYYHRAPDNWQAWDSLVYQMAYHEIKDEGIRWFEVWNEPDLGIFFPLDEDLYLTLYSNTAQALEQAAAAAGQRIYVGGPAASFDNVVFISKLAAFVVDNHLPLDFVSWHYYANDPQVGPFGDVSSLPPIGSWYNPHLSTDVYRDSVNLVASSLSSYPSLRPYLIIDEWNVDAGWDPRADSSYEAAFIASALAKMNSTDLFASCFFKGVDGSSHLQNWGVLTSAYAPKPGYYGLEYYRKLMGPSLKVSTSGQAPSGSDVGALASSPSPGTIRVLAYNFLPYSASGEYGSTSLFPGDASATISFDHLRASDYLVSVRATDPRGVDVLEASATMRPSPSGRITLALTLKAEGVYLISLSPSH